MQDKGAISTCSREGFTVKLIARIRRLLGGLDRVVVPWLIGGVILFTWVVLHDAFHLRNTVGIPYMLGLPLLIGCQMLLHGILEVIATKIARTRLEVATPHYQSANSFLERSEFDSAVDQCSLIISIDPDNARAYMGRGNVYYWKGEYDLAISDHTAAINVDPLIRGLAHRESLGDDASKYDLAWAYYYRGQSYMAKGEFENAKEDFNSAVAVGSAGFPKSLGNAGFLKALSYASPPAVQGDAVRDNGAVHYIKPCRAVRMNEDRNVFSSKYYFAVNCKVCLENRPERNSLRESFGSPLSRVIFPSLILVCPIPGWNIFGLLTGGQTFLGLLLLILILIAFLPLWTDVVSQFLMMAIRPWASRALGKPLRGNLFRGK